MKKRYILSKNISYKKEKGSSVESGKMAQVEQVCDRPSIKPSLAFHKVMDGNFTTLHWRRRRCFILTSL